VRRAGEQIKQRLVLDTAVHIYEMLNMDVAVGMRQGVRILANIVTPFGNAQRRVIEQISGCVLLLWATFILVVSTFSFGLDTDLRRGLSITHFAVR